MKSAFGYLLLAMFAIGLVGCKADSSETFAPGTQANWIGENNIQCWKREGSIILRETCDVSDTTTLTILAQEGHQLIVRINGGPYAALIDKDDFRYFVIRAQVMQERDQLVLRHLPN